MTRLERSTEIEAPPERVSKFFTDVEHLAELFPGQVELKKNYVGEPKVGDTLDMWAAVAGQRMRARIKFVEIVPLARLIIEQVSGDFKSFKDIITFGKTGSGTRVTEIWEYEPPYSILGQILDRVKIRKDVESYLAEGHRRVKERLEVGKQ